MRGASAGKHCGLWPSTRLSFPSGMPSLPFWGDRGVEGSRLRDLHCPQTGDTAPDQQPRVLAGSGAPHRPLHPEPPSPAGAPTLQTLPAACSPVLSSLALGPSCFSSGIIAARRSGAPAWKPKPVQVPPGRRSGS